MNEIKTVIFDISGVIVDARASFCRKIDVSMQYAGLCEWDISFEELLLALGRDGFDDLFDKRNVPNRRRDLFYDIWSKIPEFYPGNIYIFEGVIPTLNRLLKQGFKVAFASRLASIYRKILIMELEKGGVEDVGRIKVEGPSEEERFLPYCMQYVLKRVIESTQAPRLYVDDSINRAKIMKTIDPKIYCVGSTSGFFNESLLKVAGADDVIHKFSQITEIVR